MSIKRRYIYLFTFLIGLPALSGCVPLVAGGAVASGATIANDERTTGIFIEDQNIELKAKHILKADEELKGKIHINVVSFNTVVLVTGEAPTENLRGRVIEKIRQVPSVSHIFDEIQIAAPTSLMSRSADTLLTSKVKVKLFSDKEIDVLKVKVVTEDGVVYLMGLLNEHDMHRAGELVRRVSGVKKVVKLFQPL